MGNGFQVEERVRAEVPMTLPDTEVPMTLPDREFPVILLDTGNNNKRVSWAL